MFVLELLLAFVLLLLVFYFTMVSDFAAPAQFVYNQF